MGLTMLTYFQRDHSQSTHRLGSLIELCTCGAEFKDHYPDGRCPPKVRVVVTDNTKEIVDAPRS